MRYRTPRFRRRALRLLASLFLAPALVASTATGASATDPINIQGTIPSVELGELLDTLLNPPARVNVCPTAGMQTGTCDQAYAVVQASAGCLAPFVTEADTTRCRNLPATTNTLLAAVVTEASACASGANAVCQT